MNKKILYNLILGVMIVCLGCGGAKKGESVYDLKLLTLNGDTIKFGEFKGKVILLDFWATWCGPCRAYIPYLIKLCDKFADKGLVIIGISNDDINAQLKFRDEYMINYKLLAADNELFRNYNITGIPTTVIYNRKGKMVKREVGFNQARMDNFEEEIKKLLAD